MFLNNNKEFEKEFLCVRNIVIMSDGEYGFHVYALHGYLEEEISFYTDSENLVSIINEINERFDKKIKEKKI